MDVFINHGVTGLTLELELRNLDTARTIAASATMTETNADGEYTADVTLGVGNYHASLRRSGRPVRTGYLKILSATTYQFVQDFDDFEREPTADEIELELQDKFNDLPTKKPTLN